jgi:hypothetical protein
MQKSDVEELYGKLMATSFFADILNLRSGEDEEDPELTRHEGP